VLSNGHPYRDNADYSGRKKRQSNGKVAFLVERSCNRKSPANHLWQLICTRQGSNLQPYDPKSLKRCSLLFNRVHNYRLYLSRIQSKAYWFPWVFRPVIDGVEAVNYCTRMSCGGVQRSLSLRTPNREEAAQTAKDRYAFLSTNGWAGFDAKSQCVGANHLARGARISQIQRRHGRRFPARGKERKRPQTFDDYARCLRFIVSEIRAMTKPRSRYDYRNNGRKAWAAAIDATPLEELTLIKSGRGKRTMPPELDMTNSKDGATRPVAIRICAEHERCSQNRKSSISFVQ
jgi:hypothetical protein